MKKVRFIISILMILMTVSGWFLFSRDNISSMAKYNSELKQADEWVSEGLYDRAIEKYESAISYKNTRSNWDKLLNAYKLRSEETDIYGYTAVEEYIQQLASAVKLFDYDEDLVVELSNLYIAQSEYESAYKCLETAKDNGVESEKIDTLIDSIRYVYKLETTKFEEFLPYSNEKYTVTDGLLWGEVDSNGKLSTEFQYEYMNQLGDNNIQLITKGEDSRLYDADGKVLGIFDFTVYEAGIFSEDLIAVKNGGTYSYYDSFAEEQFGEYEEAGAFIGGKAAVKTDGKWGIIDNTGEAVTECIYDDIVLDNSGYYINNDVIIASKDGKYALYDSDFKQISDFSCDEIDIPTEDGIYAYRSGELWGFVNSEGEEIISPEYDVARSFSNGLAAVCKDERWGFITNDNKSAIDFEFHSAWYFNENGVCFVECEDAYDETGYCWEILKLELGL